MIRINLLAGERRAAPAATKSFQLAQKITVLGSLILIVSALLVGWRYWVLSQQDTQLTHDIDVAKREETRLAGVLKQVTDFETQRAQLQQRVSLIDELRRGQNAPVHIIDQISRSLPEMTWLTTVKQQGYDVTIEGRCLNYQSVSDFVANLQTSRYFASPVEIIDSQVMPSQQGGPELVRFTLRGRFQMAGIDTTPPAKKAPAKGGKVG